MTGIRLTRKIILGCGLGLLALIVLALALSTQANVTGRGGVANGAGCSCHGISPNPGVTVNLAGLPASYTALQTYGLTVSITGGPAGTDGGFDLLTDKGAFQLTGAGTQFWFANTREVTHTSAGSAQRTWTVDWVAPIAGSGDARFWLAGNAVNGDGTSLGDQWNRITPNPTIVPENVPNTPPTVTVTVPNGGERWTGGTSHTVTWTMSDTQTPQAALIAWVNYTTDGVTFSPIAGPLTGATSTLWSVPSIDNTARVQVTAKDSTGLDGSDQSNGLFTIDSTAPSVVGTNPADGEPSAPAGTAVTVDFSEGMNKAATRPAFTLRRTDTWVLLAGTFTDTLGTQITFDPSADLAPGVTYQANLTTAARDTSDTGNFLAAPFTLTFTVADFGPPVIASVSAVPDPQELGGVVNVSALVTDDGSVAEVWLDAAGPEPLNGSMGFDAGAGRYFLARPWTALGAHPFTIWARDLAGKWGSASGSFLIQDTTKPTIQHVPPTQAVVNTAIPLQASVSDNQAVAEVRVNYTDFSGTTNVSMAGSAGVYFLDLPPQPTPGFVCYFLWAIDATGNANRTDNATQAEGRSCIAIVTSDPVPPSITAVQAIPDPQQAGLPVNVSALVTDNAAVADVWMSLTDPSSVTTDNLTMTLDFSSGRYFRTAAYSILGTYQFTIYAKDTNDNTQSSAGAFQVVDTLPPAFASATAAPDPQEVLLPVGFTAVASDNVGVASVSVFVLAPGGGTTNDTMALAAGVWSASRAFGTLGVHTFTVWAQDANGNWGAASDTFLVVDTTAPTILGAAANPPTQDAGLPVNVSAVVTDNLLVAGAWLEVVRPDASATNGSMLTAGNLRYFVYTTSPEGSHSWRISAVDSAGNWAVASGNFLVVDGTPPTILSVQATPDPQQLGGVVNLTASVMDNVAVTLVVVDVTGPGGPVGNFTMSFAGAGVWYYRGPYLDIGAHAVVVWAQDSTGHWASAPGGFTIIDTVPPSFTGLTATPNPAETPSNVTVRVGITDNNNVFQAWANVTLPDGGWANLSMALQPDGSLTVTRLYTALGTYRVTVWAQDPSGNGAVSPEVTFDVVDTRAPTAVAGGDRTVAPAVELVFDGSASSDNVGIATFRWTFTYSGSPVTLTGVSPTYTFGAEGTFVITLRVTDTSGNAAADTLTIAVVVPPTPPPGSPSSPAVASTTDTSLGLSWNPSSDPVKGYLVFRGSGTGEVRLTAIPVPETSFEDTMLAPGVTYTYRIVAIGLDDQESAAATLTASTLPSPTGENPAAGNPFLLPLALSAAVAGILLLLALLLWRRRTEA